MNFFRKHQKKILAVLAGVMVLSLILPMLGSIVGVALANEGSTLQSEISDLRNEASALEAEKKTLNSRIQAVKKDKAKAMDKKELVEQQINVIRSEIATSDRLIAQYDQLIAEKEVELTEAQAKEEKQFALFCERVRSMEEDGSVSYWSILFQASDFHDLLDRLNFVNEVMAYDNAVMDQLAVARQAVKTAKEELETGRADQQSIRAGQMERKAELDECLDEADALVDEIAGQESELKKAEAALEAAAAEIDRTIAAKQEEYQKLIASGKIKVEAGSGYLWPLNGYTTLSSLYGGRIHPILKKPSQHSGIDIPAPKNTHILASRGGVVITSGWSTGGYGNYVILSHGDGTSTLYAHMNSRAVKEGDVVAQGQVIGYVGTTGRSTGNHLHFEIRIGSKRVDPIDYFPNMTLYVRSSGKTVKLDH